MTLNSNTLKVMVALCAITLLAAVVMLVFTPSDTTHVKPSEVASTDAKVAPASSGNLPVKAAAAIDAQTPLNEADERYNKVFELMSLSVTKLSVSERKKATDHILAELPYLVSVAKMSPTDAMFAHAMLLEGSNIMMTEELLDEIRHKYTDLYPQVESKQLDLHFH